MTNEQKLVKMLRIAINNGWKDKNDLSNIMEDGYYTLRYDTVFLFDDNHDIQVAASLNDLVTNFVKGEVSFIEALCNRNINDGMNIDVLYFYRSEVSLVEAVRLEWNLKPTNERLEWLFQTFNHLLV